MSTTPPPGVPPSSVPSSEIPSSAIPRTARRDPELVADSSLAPEAGAIASRAVATADGSIATAVAERDWYDDQRKEQFQEFRRWLVPSLFALTVIWLIFVGGIVLREELRQHLSDAVLIALLGTATANVLGLLVIVLKSIFPLDVGRGD